MSFSNKKTIRKIAWVLFIVYMAGITYFLFLSDWLNRDALSFVEDERYNVIFLKEMKRSFYCLKHGSVRYFLINFVFNILAFIPFGGFLPVIWPRTRGAVKFCFRSLSYILINEAIQYLTHVGIFDVDDILLNVTGCMVGYFIFWVLWRRWRRKHVGRV